MTHSFITAMQEALDTHGLPPGIAVISVGTHWQTSPIRFHAWAAEPGDRMAKHTGAADDLATACAIALERQATAGSREAKRQAARAALIAAGHDPNLIS